MFITLSQFLQLLTALAAVVPESERTPEILLVLALLGNKCFRPAGLVELFLDALRESKILSDSFPTSIDSPTFGESHLLEMFQAWFFYWEQSHSSELVCAVKSILKSTKRSLSTKITSLMEELVGQDEIPCIWNETFDGNRKSQPQLLHEEDNKSYGSAESDTPEDDGYITQNSKMCSSEGCTGNKCAGQTTCTKHTQRNKKTSASENSSNSTRPTCPDTPMSYADKTKSLNDDTGFQVQGSRQRKTGSHKSGTTNSSNSTDTTPKQCAEGTCQDMATRYSEYCHCHLNDWVNWMKENNQCQNKDSAGILCYRFSNNQLYCKDCMQDGIRCRFDLNCNNKTCQFLHGYQK